MGDITLSVAPSTVQNVAAMLGGVRGYLHRFTRDMLISEAAYTCNAAIRFTPPFPKGGGSSMSTAAKKQGEAAVERDIRSFVMPKDATMATAVQGFDRTSFLAWKSKPISGWAKRSKTSIAAKIYADPDIDRAFQKARNISGNKFAQGGHELRGTELSVVHNNLRQRYKGRITQKGGPGIAIEARPYFANQGRINSYIRTRQKAVGTVSSYWWWLIMALPKVTIHGMQKNAGQTGVPEWVKRHSANGYTFDFHGAAALPVNAIGSSVTSNSAITIRNPIGDIFGVAREARTKANVIAFRQRAVEIRNYQQVLDRAILKATKGGRLS